MKSSCRFFIIILSLLMLLFLAAISGCDSQGLPPDECASCPPAANAQPACVSGHCSFTCDEGFADCDADSTTGCEFDLDNNPSCSSDWTNLGMVRGDQGADTETVAGAGERWYRVNVTEDDFGAACQYLSLTIRLTPGAGTDYDLYVYDGSCSNLADSSGQSGNAEEAVSLSWNDECILGIPTPADQSRDIYIWVGFGSRNNCSNYVLTVSGNT